MTDWDEHWRAVKNEQSAAMARRQREQSDRERDLRDLEEKIRRRDQAFHRSLLDVARWAIRRYESAQVSPLPIYAVWIETVKPLFKSKQNERRRRQIGVCFPLYTMLSTQDTGSWDHPSVEYYRYTLVVTPEEKLLSVLRYGRRPEDIPEMTEIELIHGDSRPSNFNAVLTKYAATASPWLDEKRLDPGDDNYGLDQLCRTIVNYVGPRVDPIT